MQMIHPLLSTTSAVYNSHSPTHFSREAPASPGTINHKLSPFVSPLQAYGIGNWKVKNVSRGVEYPGKGRSNIIHRMR